MNLGTLFRLETWPPWEDDDGKAKKHSVIVAKYKPENDTYLLFPISHSIDLIDTGILLTDTKYPSAYVANSPLNMKDGPSALFIREKIGKMIVVSFAWISLQNGKVKFGNKKEEVAIKSDIIQLDEDDWDNMLLPLLRKHAQSSGLIF
jgi:hypothetical protein